MRRVLLATILLAVGVAPAYGISAGRIIAKLNAERAKLGMLPVKEKRAWSRACRRHDRWEIRNNTISHAETKGTPGYTKSGKWAGAHSDLAFGPGWRHGNPWGNAPLHLMSLYDPRLKVAGADETGRFGCFTITGYVHDRYRAQPGVPPADHVFTYPAGGTAAPYAQLAFESPYTPQEKVGIAYRHVTGPYLYVFGLTEAPAPHADALDRLVRGSLIEAGSGREVETRVIDKQVGVLAPTGAGILLPVDPLKKRTRYTATAVLASPSGREVTHTWSFRTTKRRRR
jgi:hypothetical protein